MTKNEKEVIGNVISKLDECIGKLLVPSMRDMATMEVMQEITGLNIELGDLI